MKLPLTLIFGVLSLALAIALGYEITLTRQQAGRVAQLQGEALAQRNAAAQERANAAKVLDRQKSELTAKLSRAKESLATLRQQVAADSSAPVPPAGEALAQATPSPEPEADATHGKPAGAGAMGKWLGQMLKDPAMKKVIRTQQATALRMMYGDLVKQWALSPAETDTFYNLLLDKQMGAMDASQSSLQSGAAAAGEATAAVTKDYEARIKASLGDNLYQQYQDYEKTVADRVILNQFQTQMGTSGGAALTTDQSNFLIHTMGEERQAQAANGNTAASMPGSFGTAGFQMDQKSIDAFAQAQTEINQRVDQRALGVLSPAQIEALKTYQSQMVDMQKASMSMAAKMMGGDGKGGGP